MRAMRPTVPVAAAFAARHPYRQVCTVASGGNIDTEILNTILAGLIPH